MRSVALVCVVLVALAVAGAAAGTGATAALPAPLFASVPPGGYADPFPFGECTWWAAYNHPVSWSGDAGDWLRNARAASVATTGVPSVGAIVVYRPGGPYSSLGHVALVVAVERNNYRVSEMHAPEWGVVRERDVPWPDPFAQGFIPWEESR
jgi:surface antigen